MRKQGVFPTTSEWERRYVRRAHQHVGGIPVLKPGAQGAEGSLAARAAFPTQVFVSLVI